MRPLSLEAFARERLLAARLEGSCVAVAHSSAKAIEILDAAGMAVVPSSSGADFVIDTNAQLISQMVEQRPEELASLRGVVETTAPGTAHLATLVSAGRLDVPVVAADWSKCLRASSAAASAQAVIQSILSLTNVRMPGKRVSVVGYGHVGRAIVSRVSAMGGRVTVVDADSLHLLEAHVGGHEVAELAEAVAASDIVIMTTGGELPLEAAHFGLMAASTMVIDGCGESIRLPGADIPRREVRPGVVEFDVAGVPVFVMKAVDAPVPDLSAAVAVLALAVVGRLGPGVHGFPTELDAGLANAFLGIAT